MQNPNKKNYYRPIQERKPTRWSVPMGFNKAVIASLSGQVTSSYVSMVRRGQRTNDAVLKAIIETDHNWKQLEHDRMKKML